LRNISLPFYFKMEATRLVQCSTTSHYLTYGSSVRRFGSGSRSWSRILSWDRHRPDRQYRRRRSCLSRRIGMEEGWWYHFLGLLDYRWMI